ncbi:hypothetical protein PV327_010236 [Microctonus hyperodae]|uniref:Uncharacterized protein n=1 Tax=Microctonus hyperodae TaxID=165561 RepID=A0AA39FRV2_MICHY|nr:hypothetical protein PV327_010236 [Microctonus hyperodae]
MREIIGKKAYNYLFGFETNKYSNKKLPTYREVMNVFMYKHRELKMTIRQSSTEVARELKDIWSKFLISSCRREQIIKKIETFYKEYMNLKTNRKRKKSKAQCEKVNKFTRKLDQLFDITDNKKYEHLSDTCKEFLNKSKQMIYCAGLADEILRHSAMLNNENNIESMEYEENSNGNELEQSTER